MSLVYIGTSVLGYMPVYRANNVGEEELALGDIRELDLKVVS